MQHFKSISIDTTGELADALHAFPRGTKLRLLMGSGDEEVQGMYGGKAEDGSYELHMDDEKDPRREAKQKREQEAVAKAAGSDVETEYGESPAERKARQRNQEMREKRAMAGYSGVTDKFAEYGVKEAPDGQPTGAEDTAVRESQWDKYKTADARSPAEIVRHRRAVERAADEPQYGDATKTRVPLQKAEAAARNPASQASAGQPLPERGPMSEKAIEAHEADLKAQDAEARGEQEAEGKRPPETEQDQQPQEAEAETVPAA